MARNSLVKTYGEKVLINDKYFYYIGNSQYVIASNFVGSELILKHDAYVYDADGNRIEREVLKKGEKIKTYETVKIAGREFYSIHFGRYLATGNFVGSELELAHNAYVYSERGVRIGTEVLEKGRKIKIYSTRLINGEKYYHAGHGRYILAANFEKK